MRYRLMRVEEVTIVSRHISSPFADFVLRLNGKGTTHEFTCANLLERPHEVRDEEYQENYGGNFVYEKEDHTTHYAPAILHVYAGQPDLGQLEIYEVVAE